LALGGSLTELPVNNYIILNISIVLNRNWVLFHNTGGTAKK